MNRGRWQDWVNLILGIWLFLSPFILAYTTTTGTAAWNSYILGIAIAILALLALNRPEAWEEWTSLVLGIWLILAPFILRFTFDGVATWNHIIVGILVGVSALLAAVRPRARVIPR